MSFYDYRHFRGKFLSTFHLHMAAKILCKDCKEDKLLLKKNPLTSLSSFFRLHPGAPASVRSQLWHAGRQDKPGCDLLLSAVK